jgi:hypothetical protein
MWLLLALCLAVDGPLFEDLLARHQDAWGDFPARGAEHLLRNWMLFAGFVVLQGALVLALLRLRPNDSLRTSTLQLQAERRDDSAVAPKFRRPSSQ